MKKLLTAIGLIVMAQSLTACGVEVVDTGEVGIEVRFGEVQGEPLPEGLYFYNPLTSSIMEMETKTQKMEGETTAYTKDVQQAVAKFAVNYNLLPGHAGIVYQTVGRRWDEVLLPQVIFGTLKAQIGSWDAVDLIENRELATRKIEGALASALEPKGIIVTRFELTDVQYESAFERAVEQKVIAIQNAIQEKNRTVQIEEQAKQKVIAAKAEAESMSIRNEALRQNTALIEYEAVQKWNGQLPTYMMGDAVPMINVPNGGQ